MCETVSSLIRIRRVRVACAPTRATGSVEIAPQRFHKGTLAMAEPSAHRKGRRGTVCAAPITLDAGWTPKVVEKTEDAKDRCVGAHTHPRSRWRASQQPCLGADRVGMSRSCRPCPLPCWQYFELGMAGGGGEGAAPLPRHCVPTLQNCHPALPPLLVAVPPFLCPPPRVKRSIVESGRGACHPLLLSLMLG